MPKKIVLVSLFICVNVLSIYALSPVATHGMLKTYQGKIIGEKDNQPVQLAGMSMFWSLWEGERFYNRQVVGWLVQDWNITVIRAAMGVGVYGGYDSDDNGAADNYTRVKTIVDAAIANGIYVIVDYHAHNANVNIDKAKKFFTDIASEYGNTPNIIWEIWNEPDNENGTGPDQEDTWQDIKNYAAQIIPIIRKYSNNLIVVGTPFWSQKVDQAAADPIDDPNVAYTLHFYAAQSGHKDTLRTIARTAVDLGAPLFITEFGITKANGSDSIDTVEAKIWLDWADSNGISWVNWSIVDKGELSAALVRGAAAEGGWSSDQLTISGTWIRNRLNSRPKYEYSDIIPDDGRSLPGLIEAESFTTKSEQLIVEQTSDAGGGQNLAYTTEGAWVEYNVAVRKAGDYTASLRVACDAGFGGTLTLKIDGEIKATWKVEGTGGWQSWITTDTCEKFSLPKGDAVCRIEWSGTAASLVNLNWIQFKHIVDPNSVRHFKHAGKPLIDQISVSRGFASFKAPENLASVTLLSLSGKVLYSTKVNKRNVQIPVGNGLYLLRLQDISGLFATVKILGTSN